MVLLLRVRGCASLCALSSVISVSILLSLISIPNHIHVLLLLLLHLLLLLSITQTRLPQQTRLQRRPSSQRTLALLTFRTIVRDVDEAEPRPPETVAVRPDILGGEITAVNVFFAVAAGENLDSAVAHRSCQRIRNELGWDWRADGGGFREQTKICLEEL